MSSAKNLITGKSEEVYSIVYKALERLIINRIKDGAFTDQEDVGARGYFSTLEGLEALFIPFVNLPKNVFWDSLKARHKDLPEAIQKDVNFILSHNSKVDAPPKEQGTPYFEQGKGVRQTPYWTSECASFTLSVLTNYLTLCQEMGLPCVSKEKVTKALKTNLEWIKLCRRDNGWAWTTDSSAHPWPTWSILDTFEEMLNCSLLDDLHELIIPEYKPVLLKIIESFKTNVVGSYLNDWEEKVINSTPYDVEAALDLSRLMLAVSLHSNRKDVKPLAQKLFLWSSESDFGNIDYNYHLKPKSDYIADSSLIPSVFRALVFMSGILKFKGIEDVEKHIGQNHQIVLNRVYQHLMKSHLNHGKYKNLWGVSSDGLKYELYYTERAIESLTEFLLHYQPADFKPMPNTELEEPKVEICSEVSEPAGETTLEIVPAYLPILDEIARKAAKKKGDLFKDVIIIYVLHFLNDLLPFIDKFRSLGCNPQDMFFLVKTYEYPEKDKIRKYLEDIGCTVFLPKDATEKALFAAANTMLKKCIDTSEGKGSKILIVEDGGYFAPMFHTPNFRDSIAKCIGAVEQTTKGHRRDSEIADPKFPIISVASSKLKMVLEAQDVAETLQENIVGILRKYADKPLNNLRALVLGYGTIGEKLCDALHNKGIAINVFDKDAFKRLRAEMQNKYKVLDGLDNLTGFNIIIGVSGETSLKDGEAFWNLDHNVILASGSSERVEFDLEALASNSSKISREEIFTKYTLKKGDKVIRLLLDGEPINFAISGGISNSVIDPIYSEMFLAAVQIRASEGMANGLQDLSIEIEEEVLKIFKTYHRT